MSTILVGSAPDSWGVWFPDDPNQTSYTRFLDEVADSGYQWIELGPYGYLPTDPQKLSDELASRNLKLSAGTVFEHLHRDGVDVADSWNTVWTQIEDVAKLTAAVGGKHVVVILRCGGTRPPARCSRTAISRPSSGGRRPAV